MKKSNQKKLKALKVHLGKTIRGIRTVRAGQNQVEFAKVLGTSQASLSKIESGKALPPLQVWLRLEHRYPMMRRLFAAELRG